MIHIREDRRVISFRLDLVRSFGFIVFGLLAFGFWYYQVLYGPYYRELSENNRLKTQVLYAPRGQMFDCEERLVAGNHLAFDLELVREDVTVPLDGLLAELAEVVSMTEEELRERVDQYRGLPSFRPIVLKENLTTEEVSYFAARRERYAGVYVRYKHLRHYDHNSLASHLVGYVGEVTENQIRRARASGMELQPGDVVGKAGLEYEYNDYLQGVNGLKKMVVNSIGRELHEHSRARPIQGCDVRLTIDLDLQAAAEKAFGDQTGAAVFLDPHTGRVLALVSRPAFDPNRFARRLSRTFWNSLISNEEHPLQNRVIQSKYPPGSVFKIIMAAAGLEEGVITPGSTQNCPGYTRIYNHTFHCWKGGGHGTLALEEAIRRSCNVYFYHLGAKLGIERISHWASRFGLGHKTGLDLEPETAGTCPSPEWKQKAMGQPWYPGETISISIGQGYLEVTPMQMAVFMAAIANGGKRYQPYLVDSVEPRSRYHEGLVFGPQVKGELGVREANLRVLRKAMWSVVNVTGGTARRARVEGFDVCGKTGTAQIHKASVGVKPRNLPREMRDHAWFGGFAPLEAPEIAYAVFIEHGGHGGDSAAPVVKAVLEVFKDKYHPEPPAGDMPESVMAGIHVGGSPSEGG